MELFGLKMELFWTYNGAVLDLKWSYFGPTAPKQCTIGLNWLFSVGRIRPTNVQNGPIKG